MGINDHGDVVYYNRAYLGGTKYDVQTLLGSEVTSHISLSLIDINNDGWIAATGYDTTLQQLYAYLLRPTAGLVSEPVTFSLMGHHQ